MSTHYDEYELTKFTVDMPPIPEQEMDLLCELDYSGMEFSKSDTTTCEDKTSNNTVILDNYGMINMSFFVDPISKSWADLANKQINGSWPDGAKPNGTISRHNHGGDSTTDWTVERWFIRRFAVGPFDRKQSQTPLNLRVTIRPEKVILA